MSIFKYRNVSIEEERRVGMRGRQKMGIGKGMGGDKR